MGKTDKPQLPEDISLEQNIGRIIDEIAEGLRYVIEVQQDKHGLRISVVFQDLEEAEIPAQEISDNIRAYIRGVNTVNLAISKEGYNEAEKRFWGRANEALAILGDADIKAEAKSYAPSVNQVLINIERDNPAISEEVISKLRTLGIEIRLIYNSQRPTAQRG